MSMADVLRACLADLAGPDGDGGGPGLFNEAAGQRRHVLMGLPGAAVELIAGARRAEEPERARWWELLGLTIGNAHKDAENTGRFGAPFLAEARREAEVLAGSGALDMDGALALAHAFARGGVDAPEALASFIAGRMEAEPPPTDREELRRAFHSEFGEMLKLAGGDEAGLYDQLEEQLRIHPLEVRAGMVGLLACGEEAAAGRLARYWLLHGEAEVRLAAAAGVAERARRGALDPGLAARLPTIRGWIPPDGARALLDDALRDARRRGLSAPLERPEGRVARVVGGVPDGTGSQFFAALRSGGGETVTAMFLVKSGHGIADAFMVQGEEAEVSVEAQVERGLVRDIAPEALEQALAAALAEGLAAGRPPPPVLIDAAPACGLESLRPRSMAARDWLALVDPEGEIAGYSPQKLGRLVNGSEDWPFEEPVVDTWCEGTAIVVGALKGATGERQFHAALWAALEKRRGAWVSIMLRAAHVAKASGTGPWLSFAATAFALLNGRALKKTPILHYVFEGTLDAWKAEEYDAVAESLSAEEKAEIDGYMTAAAIAPLDLDRLAWLPALMATARPADMDAAAWIASWMGARCDEIEARFAAEGPDAAALERLRDFLPAWARGFDRVCRDFRDHWPRRMLTGADRRMLKRIAAVAAGAPPGKGMDAQVAAFVQRMAPEPVEDEIE